MSGLALGMSENLVGITSVAGLLIFFTVFVGIFIWLLTRSKKQVDRWSRLPLKDKQDESPDDANYKN